MKRITQEKLQDEKKKVGYSARLYVSYIVAALILVTITNFVVKIKGFPDSGWFEADASTWITFYGTLIGGFITLLGVNQTIRFTQREDKRLQEIEQQKLKRQHDLELIRHLWELETQYHQLSKTIYLTISRLEKVNEPSINEIEEIVDFFHNSIRKHDFITLSAKIDWETYSKVTVRMKELRQLFIEAEQQLLEHREMEERKLLKNNLIRDLRKEKLEVDQVDALFEEKRAQLEEANMNQE